LRAVICLLVVFCMLPRPASAGPQQEVVTVLNEAGGAKLQVNGHDFLVKGVVWGYNPIGTNYSYSLWKQPRAFIERVLASQMTTLKKAGINAIRPFDVPPPEWVRYIYEQYGIYTAISHMMGRYGVMKDGVWVTHVDYSDPGIRAFLLADLEQTVRKYVGVPGVLV